MYPDDRVLVGVINRKRDLNYLKQQRWYRIPQGRMPHGVYTEYIAFYVSGYASKAYGTPGIHYYGKVSGVELAYRRDLVPHQPNHKRANETYYKVQFHSVIQRHPPITNDHNDSVVFIYTTWDRFVKARNIRDLYSDADYFVDRIYHALRDKRYRVERTWSAERKQTGYGPRLRILCDNGASVVASTEASQDVNVMMDADADDDEIMRSIMDQISRNGGPVTLPIHQNL